MSQQSQIDQLQETVAMLMQNMTALQTKFEALVQEKDKEIAELKAIIKSKDAEIERQRQIIRNFQRMILGQRSEKTVYLMDGAEQISLLEKLSPAQFLQKKPRKLSVNAGPFCPETASYSVRQPS